MSSDTNVAGKKNKKSAHTTDTESAKRPKPTTPAADAEKPPLARDVKPSPQDNAAAIASKKSRKRAADFLSDDGELAANTSLEPSAATKNKKKKVGTVDPANNRASSAPKTKKSKRPARPSFTADGVNGVVEHSSQEKVETASTHKPVSTSLQAEAQRTADKELEEEFGFGSEDKEKEVGVEDAGEGEGGESDPGAALLAGFDSDTTDPAQDENLDLSRIPGLPKYKQTRKKLDRAKAQGKGGSPGTVYVGRIPHGFYEEQMREYFSQFGDITRLRLSRNKRTGASKHFAFIEFQSNEVAKIVAETMDNYLMFGHILKCKYAPQESLHPDLWKGANKKYRKIPRAKLEGERLAAPKTQAEWEKKVKKEQERREKKAQKMKAIGLEMPPSTLANPADIVQQRKLALAAPETPRQIELGSAPSKPKLDGDAETVVANKKKKKTNQSTRRPPDV